MAKPKIPENFFDDIETTAKKVAEESTLVNCYNDNQKNDERTSAKIVSIYEISFNEMNNMNDTEEEIEIFAESIYQAGGVRSPLNVYSYRGEPGKKYKLLGGDRRLRALLLNSRRYPDAQQTVTVILEPVPADELEEEEKILELNENRKLDDNQKRKLCERYLHLYRNLEQAGRKPKGQLRDWMAMKMSIGIKKAEALIHDIEGMKRKKSDETLKEREKLNLFREDLRTHIQNVVQTKVKVTSKSVTFSYSGDEDLQRLLDVLGLGEVVNE